VTVALVATVALIAACVQATTGLGFALILMPGLFALTQPVPAIVTATALGLLLNLLVLFGEHRRPSVPWTEIAPLLLAVAPGSVCGLLLLDGLPEPALQIGVGIAVLGFTVLRVTRRRAGAPVHSNGSAPGRPGSLWSRLVLGFTTGTLSTSTGVSGPPVALWLSARGFSPQGVRDSLSAIFLGTGLLAAATLVPVLGRAHPDPPLLAAGAGCVIAGHALGRRLFARLNAGRFELMLFAIILAAGTTSLVIGAAAL
jgi:uncharacterized protein